MAYSTPVTEAEYKSEIIFPKTPCQASYGVSFVKIWEKIDRVMSAPHSISLPFRAVSLAWIHMVIDVTYYPWSPILKPRMHQTRLSVFLMLTSSQINIPYASTSDIAILCQLIRFFPYGINIGTTTTKRNWMSGLYRLFSGRLQCLHC